MNNDLVTVLGDVKVKVGKFYDGKRKEKYQKDLENLIKQYGTLEKDLATEERYEPIYSSLIKRGKELIREGNVRDNKKVEYYLRYCNAATYDFNDDIQHLNTILKSFIMTGVLFFVLAPMYFSYILPLLFVLPVFLGLRGMKSRTLNGLMIGVSVVPMALMVATVWLKNAYLLITTNTYDSFVAGLAKQYNIAIETSNSLAISCIGLSCVLLVSSVLTVYNAYKYRKMFI